MIYSNKMIGPASRLFKVSGRMIWFSALFMGILASIPKILQLHVTVGELMIDASIAFPFTLFSWYFNIYQLPKYFGEPIDNRFFNRRLTLSLLVGIALMVVLVLLHQLLVPGYPLNSMLMMYEFRGILIKSDGLCFPFSVVSKLSHATDQY